MKLLFTVFCFFCLSFSNSQDIPFKRNELFIEGGISEHQSINYARKVSQKISLLAGFNSWLFPAKRLHIKSTYGFSLGAFHQNDENGFGWSYGVTLFNLNNKTKYPTGAVRIYSSTGFALDGGFFYQFTHSVIFRVKVSPSFFYSSTLEKDTISFAARELPEKDKFNFGLFNLLSIAVGYKF